MGGKVGGEKKMKAGTKAPMYFQERRTRGKRGEESAREGPESGGGRLSPPSAPKKVNLDSVKNEPTPTKRRHLQGKSIKGKGSRKKGSYS